MAVTIPNVIPVCQVCDADGPAMELSEYLRNGGGECCGKPRGLLPPETIEDVEPPEPDGECFRGGEYASAFAEEQARIQRNLK